MRDNPWLERRVIAYAHQGGAKEAPSSTLYAMRRALVNGATGLELDVHATSDGQLVVCHDSTLGRTTNATGEIAGLALDEVRRRDNAYWFVPGEGATRGRPVGDYALRGRAPDDRELCVATLSEVIEVEHHLRAQATDVVGLEQPGLCGNFGRLHDVRVFAVGEVSEKVRR